jgi:hypothetical protein
MKMVKSLLLGLVKETGGIDPGGGDGISPGPGTGGEPITVFGIDGAGFG